LRLAPLLPTKCAVVGFEGVEDAVGAATEMWVLFLLFLLSVFHLLALYWINSKNRGKGIYQGIYADVNSVNAGYPVRKSRPPLLPPIPPYPSQHLESFHRPTDQTRKSVELIWSCPRETVLSFLYFIHPNTTKPNCPSV
jgi:hypothetical protein